jgi:hypothetical protein
MLGSWFSGKGKARERASDEDGAQELSYSRNNHGRSYVSTKTKINDTCRNTSTAEQHEPRAGLGVRLPLISTPHDAVLAEFFQKTNEPSPQSPSVVQPAVAAVKMAQIPSTSTTETTAAASRPEPLPDPFSGELLGMLYREPETSADSTDFEAVKDDLWSQLGQIRRLQAEIANMHVQMEGVGSASEGRQKTAPPPAGVGRLSMRRVSTGATAGEWEEGEEDEEVERKRAREAEFSQLADKFTGRKNDIDQVMGKVNAHSIVYQHAAHNAPS